MRVLLAEGDGPTRLYLTDVLSELGDVVAVSNGLEALASVEACWAQQLPYDLIVLDLNLPRRDGIDVARALRNDARYPELPPLWGVSFDRRGRGPFDRVMLRSEVADRLRKELRRGLAA